MSCVYEEENKTKKINNPKTYKARCFPNGIPVRLAQRLELLQIALAARGHSSAPDDATDGGWGGGGGREALARYSGTTAAAPQWNQGQPAKHSVDSVSLSALGSRGGGRNLVDHVETD